MIYSQWNIQRKKPVIPDALQAAGYSRLLSAVLAVRGYDTPEKASALLNVDQTQLGDPLLLEDMNNAVIEELKQLDVNTLTPIEALTKLYELKNKTV